MVMRTPPQVQLRQRPVELAFSERDIEQLSKRYPDGIPSADIIRLFQHQGVKFSEGTFRKYVQLGLLRRSRRVGRKGKHKGSTGMYPVSTVRQILAIKTMMAEGITIEQIQRSWLRFRPRIESIENDIGELLDDMERELDEPHFDLSHRTRVDVELKQARREAGELMEHFMQLEKDTSWDPDMAEQERGLEESVDEPDASDLFF